MSRRKRMLDDLEQDIRDHIEIEGTPSKVSIRNIWLKELP